MSLLSGDCCNDWRPALETYWVMMKMNVASASIAPSLAVKLDRKRQWMLWKMDAEEKKDAETRHSPERMRLKQGAVLRKSRCCCCFGCGSETPGDVKGRNRALLKNHHRHLRREWKAQRPRGQ